MTLLYLTPDGRKVAKNSGSLDNSGGTADLTGNVTVTLEELKTIASVISIIVQSATLNSYSVSGNTVTVNITVPAGKVGTVEVVAMGY